MFAWRTGAINLDGVPETPVTIVACTDLPWPEGVIKRGCWLAYTVDGGLEIRLTGGMGCLCGWAYTTDVVLGCHWELEIAVFILGNAKDGMDFCIISCCIISWYNGYQFNILLNI